MQQYQFKVCSPITSSSSLHWNTTIDKIHKAVLHHGLKYSYWHRRKIKELLYHLTYISVIKAIQMMLVDKFQTTMQGKNDSYCYVPDLISLPLHEQFLTRPHSSFLMDANHIKSLEWLRFTSKCNRLVIRPKLSSPSEKKKRNPSFLKVYWKAGKITFRKMFSLLNKNVFTPK